MKLNPIPTLSLAFAMAIGVGCNRASKGAAEKARPVDGVADADARQILKADSSQGAAAEAAAKEIPSLVFACSDGRALYLGLGQQVVASNLFAIGVDDGTGRAAENPIYPWLDGGFEAVEYMFPAGTDVMAVNVSHLPTRVVLLNGLNRRVFRLSKGDRLLPGKSELVRMNIVSEEPSLVTKDARNVRQPRSLSREEIETLKAHLIAAK